MYTTLALVATVSSVMGHGFIKESTVNKKFGPNKAPSAGSPCYKGTNPNTDDDFKSAFSQIGDFMGNKNPQAGGGCNQIGWPPKPVDLLPSQSNNVCGEGDVHGLESLKTSDIVSKYGYGATINGDKVTLSAHLTAPHGGMHAWYICKG